jgi:hypothetical protein
MLCTVLLCECISKLAYLQVLSISIIHFRPFQALSLKSRVWKFLSAFLFLLILFANSTFKEDASFFVYVRRHSTMQERKGNI